MMSLSARLCRLSRRPVKLISCREFWRAATENTLHRLRQLLANSFHPVFFDAKQRSLLHASQNASWGREQSLILHSSRFLTEQTAEYLLNLKSSLAYPNARRWKWVWQQPDAFRNIQLQAHKSKKPSANAGVFSVSDGGPGRNRPRPEDVRSRLSICLSNWVYPVCDAAAERYRSLERHTYRLMNKETLLTTKCVALAVASWLLIVWIPHLEIGQ